MAERRSAIIVILGLPWAVAGCQSAPSSPPPQVRAAVPPPVPQGARLAGLDSSTSAEADDATAEVATAAAPTTEPAVAAAVEPGADPVGIGLIVAASAGVLLTVTNIDHRHQRARRSVAAKGLTGADPTGV